MIPFSWWKWPAEGCGRLRKAAEGCRMRLREKAGGATELRKARGLIGEAAGSSARLRDLLTGL